MFCFVKVRIVSRGYLHRSTFSNDLSFRTLLFVVS
eukprot:UN05302